MDRTAAAVAVAWLAVAALAAGGARAEAPGNATVRCLQIRATGEGADKEIDPPLAELRPTLERYRYKRFQLVGESSQSGPCGSPLRFAVPGGHTLEVVPAGAAPGRVALDVTLSRGDDMVVKTRINLQNGKSVLLARELAVGEGVLFLALTASAD